MTGGIYTIRVNGSDKFYIGRTKKFTTRKAHHLWLLRRGTHHCKYLQSAFNKHGGVTFVEEQAEDDKEKRIFLEQQWFDKFSGIGLLVNHMLKATNDDIGGKTWNSDRKRVPHNKGKASPFKGIKRDPEIAKKISKTKKEKGQTKKQLIALVENRKNFDAKKPRGPMSESAKKNLSALRSGVKRGPYKRGMGAGK